jgi:hypothetical protein
VQTALASVPTPRRLANRYTVGLTKTTPTSIALAMERKLTARGATSDQGRPWTPRSRCSVGKQSNKILDDPDIMHTAHEQSIYRGSRYDDKVDLLCRQVDDIAVACLIAEKIARYLWSILIELSFPPTEPPLLYEDNKAAIGMLNVNRATQRSRHIDSGGSTATSSSHVSLVSPTQPDA